MYRLETVVEQLPDILLASSADAKSEDEQLLVLRTFEFNLSQGNFELAYNAIKNLSLSRMRGGLVVSAAEILRGTYACLVGIHNLALIKSLDNLRDDIVRYRQQAHVDGSTVTPLCIRLIHLQYNTAGSTFSLQEIADDEFLMDCLRSDFFNNPEIEIFLTDIRRQLLLSSATKLEIDSRYLSLYQALALQGYLTDYVFYCHEDESELVELLDQAVANHLAQKGNLLDDDDVLPLLLLYTMYEPLTNMNPQARAALAELNIDQLPQYLQAIYLHTYSQRLEREAIAAQIKTLGKIKLSSRHVQQQYEENPYPRKSRLDHLRVAVSYLEGCQHLSASEFHFDVLQGRPLEMLVAGCGTGFQALEIARSCKHVNIIAVDISRKSLACGEQLKAAYGIDNVQFFFRQIF